MILIQADLLRFNLPQFIPVAGKTLYDKAMQAHQEDDFEFERRFLVKTFPNQLIDGEPANVIVQTYFLAEDGYGLRIRLQVTNSSKDLPIEMDGKKAIESFADHFDLCVLTAKGPAISGTRYEAERELDVSIGVEMSLRGGSTIAKRRFGVWLDEDGWIIDQFCGQNAPLIIAECERTSPVTNLAIPSFCYREVTEDHRFSNDFLANHPYESWYKELPDPPTGRSGNFLTQFGQNSTSSS